MGSPLPPDPYEALGVPKDATSAAVKTAHRKLVLKCHPDKVTDPAEKQAASDKFHKIQSAYEILIDEARRERYDAQVRLAELRKEALARQQNDGGRSRAAEPRTSPYKSYAAQEPPRGAYAPRTEERRPSYVNDYPDIPPRATTRKEPEPERTSRRQDVKEKLRSAARAAKNHKEEEKERRKEKTRQAERDIRRDRDRKTPYVVDAAESDSESDEQERYQRRVREEEATRRAKEAYYAQAFRQRREAEDGQYDERTRKMFANVADVRDYIATSRGGRRAEAEREMEREPERPRERRPSPVRHASSRDDVEYIKRKDKDGRPAAMVRKSSSKPSKDASREKESKKNSSRTPERRSSEERFEERRPPTLKETKSSPANIHIPTMDKPRAASLQVDPPEARPMPQVRRSETMPYNNASRGRSENTVPKVATNLRATEVNDGVPTPAATPEYQDPFSKARFDYGKMYADDHEFATPDGYRTEVHEPAGPRAARPQQRPQYTRKVTRSPSPVKETQVPTRDTRTPREYREAPRDSRESRDTRDARDPRATTHRSNSARYQSAPQPPPLNTRTTSYVYNGKGSVDPYDGARPSREGSPREPSYRYDSKPLYGEMRDSRPTSGSPRQSYGPYAPPDRDDGVNYRKVYRPEDIRVQSGYSTKRTDRPTLSRGNSGNNSYYHPQPIRT